MAEKCVPCVANSRRDALCACAFEARRSLFPVVTHAYASSRRCPKRATGAGSKLHLAIHYLRVLSCLWPRDWDLRQSDR